MLEKISILLIFSWNPLVAFKEQDWVRIILEIEDDSISYFDLGIRVSDKDY